jgi:hypothetical protein
LLLHQLLLQGADLLLCSTERQAQFFLLNDRLLNLPG